MRCGIAFSRRGPPLDPPSRFSMTSPDSRRTDSVARDGCRATRWTHDLCLSPLALCTAPGRVLWLSLSVAFEFLLYRQLLTLPRSDRDRTQFYERPRCWKKNTTFREKQMPRQKKTFKLLCARHSVTISRHNARTWPLQRGKVFSCRPVEKRHAGRHLISRAALDHPAVLFFQDLFTWRRPVFDNGTIKGQPFLGASSDPNGSIRHNVYGN